MWAAVRNIQPFDLAIHVGIGAGATLLATAMNLWFGLAVVVANLVFWPVRENSQTDNQNWAIVYWSLKKHLEAFAPGVVSIFTWWLSI